MGLASALPGEVELKKIIFLTIAVAVLAGCAARGYRSDFEFANRLAREGLWQEAHFRLQKARAAGSDSAALHNNLAVVLEGLERYEEARSEYELALKKDPGNERIQSNLDRLKKNQEKAVHEKK
jgi:Flp pilus assembly protein TadD